MKKYKVISGSCVCVPQKAILKHGEIKPADFFLETQLADLLTRKFIEEVGEKTPQEEVKKKK